VCNNAGDGGELAHHFALITSLMKVFFLVVLLAVLGATVSAWLYLLLVLILNADFLIDSQMDRSTPPHCLRLELKTDHMLVHQEDHEIFDLISAVEAAEGHPFSLFFSLCPHRPTPHAQAKTRRSTHGLTCLRRHLRTIS
jgi:hypothetical protein